MSAMQNTYALIIGIANYHNIRRLPPTVMKDAQDIYDLLINPQYCGYLPDNVQLLLDQEATCSNVKQSLVELSQKAKPDSTVFIYFSGHGGYCTVEKKTISYLLTVDTQIDSDRLPNEKVISGEDFTKALREISARKVIVIFDCCHAGGIGETKSPSIGLMKTGIPDDFNEDKTKYNGLKIAIANHAEGVFKTIGKNQEKIPYQKRTCQKIARNIFLRLVQFSEGKKNISRQQAISELQITGKENLVKNTLNDLANGRLLTMDKKEDLNVRVDIAHEALISAWPRFQGWIRDYKDAEQARRKLDEKVDECHKLNRKLDEKELEYVDTILNQHSSYIENPDKDLLELIKSSQEKIYRENREKEKEKKNKIILLRVLGGISVITIYSVYFYWRKILIPFDFVFQDLIVPNYLFPKLEQSLSKSEFQEAQKNTKEILLEKWGFYADLNENNILDKEEEAERISCETLFKIESLWQKYTENRCGWYSSDLQSPNYEFYNFECEELVTRAEQEVENLQTGKMEKETIRFGGTLLDSIFGNYPDFALEKIDQCQQKSSDINTINTS